MKLGSKESYYIFIGIVKMLHKQFYRIFKDLKENQDGSVFKKYAGITYRLIFQKQYQPQVKLGYSKKNID